MAILIFSQQLKTPGCIMADSDIKFINLHAHSNASVFDGLGYPKEHIDFAIENGMNAMALTDHGNMGNFSYQVLYALELQKKGVDFKPIFGIEAYVHPSIEKWLELYENQPKKKKLKEDGQNATVIEDEKRTIKSDLNHRRHMILIAKNQTGLKNLFKMVSKSFERPNFYRFPRIDYKTLRENSEGILATSACIGGVYGAEFWKHREEGSEAVLRAMRDTTRTMMDIYGEAWYGELQWNAIPEQHEINQLVIQLHKEYGFKLVSAADVHYPTRDSWKDRELYKRLGWLKNKDGLEAIPDSIEEMKYELWPKNGDQMWESYKRYSEKAGVEYNDQMILESIERTHEIAFQEVEDFMPDTSVRLPSFVLKEGRTEDELLREAVFRRFKEFKFCNDEKYQTRINNELYIIADRKFSKYFLTMSAINEETRKLMLVGPGRGSGCGSLVAYVLGITEIDPIRWDTQFERFLRSDAVEMPDIDYDCESPMELKEHLIDLWGENTVVPISNWNTLQLRSLIKDISKYHDIDFMEVNKVTAVMEREATPEAKKKHDIKSGVYAPTYEEVKEFSPTLQKFLKKYTEVGRQVDALIGQKRSLSRHAGGVVIADNLNEHMPLIVSDGVKQAPWSEGQAVRHLEPLGFIKFDLLGLSTLKMIRYAISHCLKREQGIKKPTFEDVEGFYNEHLHTDNIDFDDREVYHDVFHNGKWAGIFQYTELGAQNLCSNVKPLSLIDLATITAIYRPGPLGFDVDKKYLRARERPKSVRYLNDIHKKITKDTFGFLIFQEQIAKLVHELGKNISLDEGNMLRKVLTKKGTGKEVKIKESIYDRFIEGCLEKDISKRDSDGLWDTIVSFSQYGFNYSHSLAYSVISFQCAWFMHYHPECWMAAYLQIESEKPDSAASKHKKEKAIAFAKSMGYEVKAPSVNHSSDTWEISSDGQTLFQPLTDVKGVGAAAYRDLIEYRPFNKIEDILFHSEMKSPNKSVLDKLIRAGAMDELMDNRFNGLKHFWSVVAVEKPKTESTFLANLENPDFLEEGNFSTSERIAYISQLTNVFPIDMVLTPAVQRQLKTYGIPPIGDYDKDLMYCWFIPREIVVRKTAKGKMYWILKVIDSTFKMTQIKCWGIKEGRDKIILNKPYVVKKLDYSEQWGFSTPWSSSIKENFMLMSGE
jgi:DNA polymerase III subunit alpha